MNSVLPTGSPRAFHRTDLSDLVNNSNGGHQLNILEDLPQFNHERERLKSFDGWPVSFLSSSAMAAAGFYYLKRGDYVRCAFCGVEVGSWAEGDDPMQDHERWSPSCKFVKKLPVGNVPLNSTNTNDVEVPKDNGYDTCGRIEFRQESGIVLNTKDTHLPSLEKLGIHKSRAPSFPHMASIESRILSYDMWPIALKLKPNILSEAGFFYTGKGDQTICFHCGGGLKDWEESDEPWVEHARWFSKCNFVLLVKGKDFVDKVCGRKLSKEKSKSEENFQSVAKSISICNRKEEKTTSQKNLCEESNTENAGVCKICYTEEVGVVFLPCGHLVACVKCALSLTTCAVCRQTVNATVRAYLS